MKIQKYLLALLMGSATLTFSSCNDFLDREPLGKFTENDDPNALVKGKAYNLYYLMRSYNITAGIPSFMIEMARSEDSEKGSDSGDGTDVADMYDDFKYTASNGTMAAYWEQNYKVIYQCNDILEDIETNGKTDSESMINKGEALFFRAYCYFNMVRAWGEVPLVTWKVVEAAEANVAKSSADKIYELIDSDLTEAETLMPRSWSTEYTGRVTWGAVQSLRARTFMQRNNWDKMYEYSLEVINSGLYNLTTPVDKIFLVEGENCGASIFELQCLATSALPSSLTIGGQFAEVQGIRGSGEWNLGWGWHMGTTLLGTAFETGDPRKNATLLYFRRSISDPITADNTNQPWNESPVSTAMGGYFNRKAYAEPQYRAQFAKNGTWVNIRLIRYPDVLLMAAEAANEKGMTVESKKYLEMVRAHARGTDTSVLPEVTTNDQVTLRNAIMHERRVELALEPGRFYDLVRWGTAAQVLHAAGKSEYSAIKDLLPIPQKMIDVSKGVLIQNPNY